MSTTTVEKPRFTARDFQSGEDPRWCPGCGDYSILKQVQTVLAEKGYQPHQVVFVSGIGCSSRFPYYMNAYGLHGIHGRAPAIAMGVKLVRPDLSVWVITGDGDGLAIGGNHLIHAMRRNLNINILLFNNEIYGLTKGQLSPTSRLNQVTKSSPWGNIDNPFNPLLLALGAGATFVARTADRMPAHLRQILNEADEHQGVSFVEIYQNCNVFNDGAFFAYTESDSQPENAVFAEHGKPLIFGANKNKALILRNSTVQVVEFDPQEGIPEDVWVHDETSLEKALLLASLSPEPGTDMPRPFGIIYRVRKPTYEELLAERRSLAKTPPLQELLQGSETWEVK